MTFPPQLRLEYNLILVKVYGLAVRAKKHFGAILSEGEASEEEEENIASDHSLVESKHRYIYY